MRRENRNNWHRTAWIAAGITLIVIVLGFYTISLNPLHSARNSAINIAQTKADVTSVGNFYWDRQRESYLTVAGTTAKKQAVYVVIRQKTGKINVLTQHSGISATKAANQAVASFSPKRILSVAMGKRGKKFVWDVGYRTKSGKLGYVTYDFKTGDQVNSIRNL